MGLLDLRMLRPWRATGDAAYWYPAVAMAALSLAAALFGDAGREALRYDRLSISDGQYWRLVTGHFAHLGGTHLALNLAGLILVWLLVGRYFSAARWCAVVAVTLVVMSAAFWFIDTGLIWYVGLSGLLHGLLIAGAIAGFRSLPGEFGIIIVIVFAKLAWEQIFGPVPGSESVSGGAVVVNAHLFGAAGGAIAAVAFLRGPRKQRSI